MNPSSYSKIISPEDYNRLIREHLYISTADEAIARLVAHHNLAGQGAEVVEFGCGPARILPLLSRVRRIFLTGIDHDETFIEYAQRVIKECNIDAHVVLADAMTYHHPEPINIAVSQGFHHHIPKGVETRDYLERIHAQLTPGGVYILGDEFLPDYDPSQEGMRADRAIVWYSHIIHNALKGQYRQLAAEEAKTLLDDLAEGQPQKGVKTDAQIQLTLDWAKDIDGTACSGNRTELDRLTSVFKDQLSLLKTTTPTGNPSIDLSRGDFKICHRVFEQEVTEAGFTITGIKTEGPIDTIGGLVVYVLRKL